MGVVSIRYSNYPAAVSSPSRVQVCVVWREVPHTKCVLSTFYYHLLLFYHHSNIYFHVFYVKEVFRGIGEKSVFPACHLELEVINILHFCSTAKGFYCKKKLRVQSLLYQLLTV